LLDHHRNKRSGHGIGGELALGIGRSEQVDHGNPLWKWHAYVGAETSMFKGVNRKIALVLPPTSPSPVTRVQLSFLNFLYNSFGSSNTLAMANQDDHRFDSHSRDTPGPSEWQHLVALLAMALGVLGLATALTWASLVRGPWYDEFYTWFVTRPDRSLPASLRESWLVDNHPPLFYLLSWLGAHFAPTLEALRLLNLAGLGAASLGGWLLLRRSAQAWPFAAPFVLVLAANVYALLCATELRSYFLSFLVGALLALVLALGWLEGELRGRAQRLVLWIVLLVGFNLHILTSVIVGAVLVPFLGAALLTGRRSLFRQLIVPAMTGGAIFLAIGAIQIPLWEANTTSFWIPAGLEVAIRTLRYSLQRAAEANLAILLGGLAGAALLGWQALRERRLDPMLQAMLLFAAGVILASGLVVGLHLIRPVVMERYLIAMIPALAMGLALGCAALLRRLPGWLGNALLLGASALTLWSLWGNAAIMAKVASWEGTAAQLGVLRQNCPDSPVHIDPLQWNGITAALQPADNQRVLFSAYQMMAQRHGFVIEPAASRRVSGACPTLFWAEHDDSNKWDEARILAHLRERGFSVDRIWHYRIGIGWIASNRPLDISRR
jgi:hypothetical protein